MWRNRRARLVRLSAALAVALIPALCANTRHALGRAPVLVPYTSKLYPYSIGYPSGWHYLPFSIGNSKADMFRSATTTDGLADNVSVIETAINTPMTDAALQRQTEAYIRRAFRISPQTVGHALVAGHRVALVAYSVAFGGLKISETQALVVLGSSAWAFTLAVVPRDTVSMRQIFIAMLGSFKRR